MKPARFFICTMALSISALILLGSPITYGKEASPKSAETKSEKGVQSEVKNSAKNNAKSSAKEGKKKTMNANSKAGAKPVVVMETSKGTIEIELWPDKAPITVENFLSYVDKGHYDGTIFHRVIPDFMIQGGGMTADMNEKQTGQPIKNEADNGAANNRGTIAMARTMIVDSATAQFFINVKDNSFLNHRDKSQAGYGYAVFGEVKSGMDVVDAIKAVPTGSKQGHENVPVEPVVIKSMKRK